MGWIEGIDYEYECVNGDRGDIYRRVENEEGILGGIGGLVISSAGVDLGYDFSYPTIRSGLILLVHGDVTKGMFDFFNMFELGLWMTILATTIALAHLIWLFERDEHEEEFPKDYLGGMKEALWYAFAMLFFANDKPLKSLPARIVACAFWMMMVIIIAAYTANLTVLITADMERIDSVTDIDGLTVHCESTYASAIAKYNPYIEFKRLHELEIMKESLTALEDGDISAIVVEKLPGQYIGTDNCKVLHTEDVFYDFNYGMVIGDEFPEETVELINDQIVALQQDVEYMKILDEDYIHDVGDCSATINDHQLDFMYFIGLWILLFAAIGVAAAMLGVEIFLNWRKSKQEAEKGKEGAEEIEMEDEAEAIKKELEEQDKLLAEIKKLV